MNTIRLTTKCGYTWTTSINAKCSCDDIDQYFLNKAFNIGNNDDDKMGVVVQWQFVHEYEIINQNDYNVDNKEFALFADDKEAITYVKAKQAQGIQFYQHVNIWESCLDRFVGEVKA